MGDKIHRQDTMKELGVPCGFPGSAVAGVPQLADATRIGEEIAYSGASSRQPPWWLQGP